MMKAVAARIARRPPRTRAPRAPARRACLPLTLKTPPCLSFFPGAPRAPTFPSRRSSRRAIAPAPSSHCRPSTRPDDPLAAFSRRAAAASMALLLHGLACPCHHVPELHHHRTRSIRRRTKQAVLRPWPGGPPASAQAVRHSWWAEPSRQASAASLLGRPARAPPLRTSPRARRLLSAEVAALSGVQQYVLQDGVGCNAASTSNPHQASAPSQHPRIAAPSSALNVSKDWPPAALTPCPDTRPGRAA